jgi:hypothetical protein
VPIDLPLGEELDWKPVPRPTSVSLRGAHILVRPVNAASDAAPLFSVSHPPDGDQAGGAEERVLVLSADPPGMRAGRVIELQLHALQNTRGTPFAVR